MDADYLEEQEGDPDRYDDMDTRKIRSGAFRGGGRCVVR
jgi:hypothetical protein